MLAITDLQSVGGYGGEVMAARSSIGRLSASQERPDMISRFDDSLFAGHLGVSRTRVYWPGLHHNIRSYLASCTACLARKSPCPLMAPMGHVDVGHRWDRVAMDLLQGAAISHKLSHISCSLMLYRHLLG